MSSQRTIREIVAERIRLAAEIASANKRLTEVDEELAAHLEKINALVEALGFTTQPGVGVALLNAAAPSMRGSDEVRPGRKPSSIGLSIQAGVTQLLAEGPKSTRALFEGLTAMGIDVPGNNPLNNLSAHLSRIPTVMRGVDGWELNEDTQNSLNLAG